jgi:ArsR family transcriptional regulator, lead/cadmium/zinc/bismuth-responsive transcriptional repressor
MQHMPGRQRTHPTAEHPARIGVELPARPQIETAAAIFRVLGDPERLRLLVRLSGGEACVSDLADEEDEKITTVSARLKTLHAVRLVTRRRAGKHVFYALADQHVLRLIRNAVDHAAEGGRDAAAAAVSAAAFSGHGEEEDE